MHGFWEEIRAFVLALLLLALMVIMTSCNETNTRSESKKVGSLVTKEVIRETPLTNGGKLVERTLTTDTKSADDYTEKVTTAPDATTNSLINTLAPVVGAVIGTATGTPGLPWETIVASATAVAAAGFGALKAGQSKAKDQVIENVKEERDFHKNDAAEAYAKLDAKT